MAHKWETVTIKGHMALVKSPKRRCVKCEVTQTYETRTAWMRVIGYHWYPLVGRCPKDSKRILKQKERAHGSTNSKTD